jgi:hypothetical protein
MTIRHRRLRNRLWLSAMLLCAACDAGVTDPVPDFPVAQQRAVTRAQFGLDWPFDAAAGTLACKDQAVAFRTNGETYAVNDAAARLGLRQVSGLVRLQRGGPPTNPLSRVRQEDRQRIFRQSMLCEKFLVPDSVARCKAELRDGSGLSAPELTQIEAEGQERRWPPLVLQPTSLDAMTRAGLKLCAR